LTIAGTKIDPVDQQLAGHLPARDVPVFIDGQRRRPGSKRHRRCHLVERKRQFHFPGSDVSRRGFRRKFRPPRDSDHKRNGLHFADNIQACDDFFRMGIDPFLGIERHSMQGIVAGPGGLGFGQIVGVVAPPVIHVNAILHRHLHLRSIRVVNSISPDDSPRPRAAVEKDQPRRLAIDGNSLHLANQALLEFPAREHDRLPAVPLHHMERHTAEDLVARRQDAKVVMALIGPAALTIIGRIVSKRAIHKRTEVHGEEIFRIRHLSLLPRPAHPKIRQQGLAHPPGLGRPGPKPVDLIDHQATFSEFHFLHKSRLSQRLGFWNFERGSPEIFYIVDGGIRTVVTPSQIGSA